MKQGSFLWQLCMTAAISILVAIATVSIWYQPSSRTDLTQVQTDLQEITKSLTLLREKITVVSTFEEQLQPITARLDHLEADLTTLKSTQSEKNVPPQETEPTIIPQEPTNDHVSLPEPSEILKSFYHSLVTGSVNSDEIDRVNKILPTDHQIPASVVSIRDLSDKLQLLPEVKREISVEVDHSSWKKAVDAMGLKVRKTESIPLKEQAMTSLKQLDFNFLPALDRASLTPEWMEWTKECRKTKTALDLITSHLEESTHTKGESR